MTAYIFETITDAQAAAFQAGDTLTFTNPTLTAQSVEVRFTPQTGGGFPAPVVPATITLTVGLTSKVFSSALAGMGRTILPLPLAESAIAQGRLTVIDGPEPSRRSYWLLAPPPQWRSKKVRALVGYLSE